MSEQSGYIYNCPACFATTPKACVCGKRASDMPWDLGERIMSGEVIELPEGVNVLTGSRANEVRVTDPVTGGEKGDKPQRMDLLPWDALMKVSEHYAYGAGKYEDRNWERGYAWHLTFAALSRHLAAWWQGEEQDEDGNDHLDAVVFHALALRTFSLRGLGTDDRP